MKDDNIDIYKMSNKQERIISELLELASHSKQRTKIAAAICSGGKILSIDVNTHRNKYGNEIRCCGHAETACIHNYLPWAFKNKFKKYYFL